MRELEWRIDDRPVDYPAAVAAMEARVAAIRAGRARELVWLLEHPPLYTAGTSARDADLLEPERFPVYRSGRGGQFTYHGPGQLVGYPIINLLRWNGGALKYVRTLERVLIDTLSEFGIHAEGEDRPTGVWVGEAKIEAIGVRISRGVTMHGFALNVDPDLSYFDHIVPCGMPGLEVTSMSAVLRKQVLVENVAPVLARQFGLTFGRTVQWTDNRQHPADRRPASARA